VSADNVAPAAKTPGGFGPLRQQVFAVLWIATVLGNTGSFIRDVTSSWLVTDLAGGPAAVAMVQAAGTLPVFFLAIPAGVLSDILDRRKFLVLVQMMLAAVSAALLLLAYFNALTVPYLIALTFTGGVGAALVSPTWQSIVPELVPRAELKDAIALNSLGVNIARSIGPAAGGLLLAAFGASITYGADVISYLIVIAALLWWRRPVAVENAFPEKFLGAFRAGIRYARASGELHVVLLRAAVFFAFASAVWALLPLVARDTLHGGPGFYGVLLGAIGAGAILGALSLPHLRRRLDADGLLLLASLITAAVTFVLAVGSSKPIAIVVLLFLGAAWIVALTTLNGVAQSILPNWVRGRGLAVYLMVFNGAMAAGSLGWGTLAQGSSVRMSLTIGAAGMCLVALSLFRLRLPAAELDLTSSNQWPEPLLAEPVPNDRGPVLILIDYFIREEDAENFVRLLTMLSRERLRDGAYAWGVTQDAARPQRVVEWFMVESWAEHLRQHQRFSHAGADLQREVISYHQGAEPPLVTHLLSFDIKTVSLPAAGNPEKGQA
jgi:MFS family permease